MKNNLKKNDSVRIHREVWTKKKKKIREGKEEHCGIENIAAILKWRILSNQSSLLEEQRKRMETNREILIIP